MLDFCLLNRELFVLFCKQCFMKLKTESKADNVFADLVCGSGD